MRAADATWTVIDFETTGTLPDWPEEPWQIGMAVVQAGHCLTEPRFESLLHVDPARPFNPFATGRHATLRDAIAVAPSLTDLWPQLNHWLSQRPLVAHGVPTERRILQHAFPLRPMGPWIDTLALVRAAYPKLRSHKLEDLITRLGLEESLSGSLPGRASHDALFDAAAAGALLSHILQLEGWKEATVAFLADLMAPRT